MGPPSLGRILLHYHTCIIFCNNLLRQKALFVFQILCLVKRLQTWECLSRSHHEENQDIIIKTLSDVTFEGYHHGHDDEITRRESSCESLSYLCRKLNVFWLKTLDSMGGQRLLRLNPPLTAFILLQRKKTTESETQVFSPPNVLFSSSSWLHHDINCHFVFLLALFSFSHGESSASWSTLSVTCFGCSSSEKRQTI